MNVPIVLAIGVVAVDVVRFGLDLEAVGQTNVWLPHLPRWAFGAMAAVGFATMLVLTNLYRYFPSVGVYPRSLLPCSCGT